jgi:cell division transport system permease protein
MGITMLSRGDLAFHRDATQSYLPWILGFMTFLALIAGFAGLYLAELNDRWHHLLGVHVTIEVPRDEEKARPFADQAAEIMEHIKGVPGLQSAELLTMDEMIHLLRPWLGETVEKADLPLPILIRVFTQPQAILDVAALKDRLAEVAPGAVIGGESEWLGNALAMVDRLALFSWLILFLAALIVVASVAMLSKMTLAIHTRTVEILHWIGAKDSYLARQFQLYVLWMAIKGGGMGAVLALAALAVMGIGLDGWSHGSDINIMNIVASWTWFPWAFLAVIPFGTALLSMVVARWTILAELKSSS